MSRRPVSPEDDERRMLRRRGKREEGQVRLPPPLGHALQHFRDVLPTFLGRPFGRPLSNALAAEHSLQLGRRLAAL